MKRIDDVFDEIASFANLARAARRAARAKRRTKGVACFLERLEPELFALQRELVSGTYRPGTPQTFVVHDPKTREITAAPFRDRVLHHALIDPLEPFLDARMIDASFACRRGKGQHRALRHAQRLLRRHDWFLKLDVAGFFPSLPHAVVIDTLHGLIADTRVLALCERIVRHGGADGRGLPIGNLTSQWFANLVLDRLDRWLVDERRIPGYVRYMDDFVLFADDKPRLREELAAVADRLATLGLTLKDRATLLAPAFQGLPFLGFRIHPGTVRVRPENLRRCRARVRRRERQHIHGHIDEQQLARSVAAITEHLRHANTLGLRRAWLCRDLERERVAGSGNRVNRGGSFNDTARNARSANRNNNPPTIRNDDLGARPAKTSHRPDLGGRRFLETGSAPPGSAP